MTKKVPASSVAFLFLSLLKNRNDKKDYEITCNDDENGNVSIDLSLYVQRVGVVGLPLPVGGACTASVHISFDDIIESIRSLTSGCVLLDESKIESMESIDGEVAGYRGSQYAAVLGLKPFYGVKRVVLNDIDKHTMSARERMTVMYGAVKMLVKYQVTRSKAKGGGSVPENLVEESVQRYLTYLSKKNKTVGFNFPGNHEKFVRVVGILKEKRHDLESDIQYLTYGVYRAWCERTEQVRPAAPAPASLDADTIKWLDEYKWTDVLDGHPLVLPEQDDRQEVLDLADGNGLGAAAHLAAQATVAVVPEPEEAAKTKKKEEAKKMEEAKKKRKEAKKKKEEDDAATKRPGGGENPAPSPHKRSRKEKGAGGSGGKGGER